LYMASIDAGRQPVEALSQYVSENVRAGADGEGGLVRLAVTMPAPLLAARVANAYAQAWGEVSLELRSSAVRSGLERAHQDLVSLRARLGEARSRQGDNGAMAAAAWRADEQFAQLARLSARLLDSVSRTGVPSPAGLPADDATGALPGVATAHLDVNMAGGGALDALVHGPGGTSAYAADQHSAHDGDVVSVSDEIRLAQQSLERAEQRLAHLATETIGEPFPAHLLRAAAIPQSSIKPGIAICAALGAAVGLLLGIVAAALVEMFDRRVRRPADLARVAGIVVLGNLPSGTVKKQPGNKRGRLPVSWSRLERAG